LLKPLFFCEIVDHISFVRFVFLYCKCNHGVLIIQWMLVLLYRGSMVIL